MKVAHNKHFTVRSICEQLPVIVLQLLEHSMSAVWVIYIVVAKYHYTLFKQKYLSNFN